MQNGELDPVERGDSPILGEFDPRVALPEDIKMFDLNAQDNVQEETDLQLPIQTTLPNASHLQEGGSTYIPVNTQVSTWATPATQETQNILAAKTPIRDNVNLRRNISQKAYLFDRPDSYRSNDSGYYTASNRGSLMTLASNGSSLFRADSVSHSGIDAHDKLIPTVINSGTSLFQPGNLVNESHSGSHMDIHHEVGTISEEQSLEDANDVYFPPHAAPSRCIFAKHQPYNRTLVVQDGCPLCGANRFHYLASVASKLNFDELFVQLKALKHFSPNINECDMFGNSPLHFLATCRPRLGHIQAFRQAGADLHIRNHSGETFLHVLNPHILGAEILRVLELSVRYLSPSSRILFLRSRSHDSKSILHCLATRKLDPRIRSVVFDWFKSMHVNVFARDNAGQTPVDYISASQHFLQPTSQQRPISDGSQNVQQLQIKNHEMEKVLSKCPTNPFYEDAEGHNSLLCLAYMVLPARKRAEFLNDCITHGADVDHFDKQGKTPIHALILKPRFSGGSREDDDTTASFVQRLIQAGANINLRDRHGETPLHFAVKWGHEACTRLLLQYGADPNVVNIHGRSVIQEAESWLDSNEPDVFGRIKLCMALVRASGGEDDPLDDAAKQHLRQQSM